MVFCVFFIVVRVVDMGMSDLRKVGIFVFRICFIWVLFVWKVVGVVREG